jgi:hypothetical protein
VQGRQCQPAARRVAHEGDLPGIETAGEPAIDRDRVFERGRKPVLGGEPIIEVQTQAPAAAPIRQVKSRNSAAVPTA